MTPISIDFTTLPDGNHAAIAFYPIATAMHARNLPNLTHEGRVYVPYTGTVVTPDRTVKHGRPVGFYMEYRALHPLLCRTCGEGGHQVDGQCVLCTTRPTPAPQP